MLQNKQMNEIPKKLFCKSLNSLLLHSKKGSKWHELRALKILLVFKGYVDITQKCMHSFPDLESSLAKDSCSMLIFHKP